MRRWRGGCFLSLYLLVLTANSTLGRIEGATLFAGIIAYTFINYYLAKKETREVAGSGEMAARRLRPPRGTCSRARAARIG